MFQTTAKPAKRFYLLFARTGTNIIATTDMIEKHRKELEKLPDEIKHEINKCLEIYKELERYDSGDMDISTLEKTLGNILDRYEI